MSFLATSTRVPFCYRGRGHLQKAHVVGSPFSMWLLTKANLALHLLQQPIFHIFTQVTNTSCLQSDVT